MPDYYPQPNITITDLTGWGQYLNSITLDGFGPAVLIMIFFITFFMIKTGDSGPRSFTVASFLTGIVSIGTMIIGWTSISATLLMLLMTLGGMIFSRNRED